MDRSPSRCPLLAKLRGQRQLGSPVRAAAQRSRRDLARADPAPLSLGADHKAVAVGVLEGRGCAPLVALRFHHELNALAFQLAGGALDVIRPERNIHLPAGLKALAKLEQNDSG